MNINLECPRCQMEDESVSHILFDCNASRGVWADSPFYSLCDLVRGLDFCSMLELAYDRLQLVMFEFIVVILWMLWFIHNKTVLGEEDPDFSPLLPLNFS